VVSSGGGGWALAARVEDEFFISFLIISQKYRTVSNFYTFDNHSPWASHGGSEVAVGYGGGRWRLQCPRRRQEAAKQPPWATAVSFFN
jgi:hypothetical protein